MKEKENAKMEIPPLSYTFRSAGFINPREIWSKAEEMSTKVDEAFGSLSIDMVEVEDQEARGKQYRIIFIPAGINFGQLDHSRASCCL